MLENRAYNKNHQQQQKKQLLSHAQRQQNLNSYAQDYNNPFKLPQINLYSSIQNGNESQVSTKSIYSKQPYASNSQNKGDTQIESQRYQKALSFRKDQEKQLVLPKISKNNEHNNIVEINKEQLQEPLKSSKVSKSSNRRSKYENNSQQKQILIQVESNKKASPKKHQFSPKRYTNMDSSQNQDYRDTFAMQVQKRLKKIMQGGKLQDPLQIKLQQQEDFQTKINKNRELIKKYKMQNSIPLKSKEFASKDLYQGILKKKQQIQQNGSIPKMLKGNAYKNYSNIGDTKFEKDNVFSQKKSLQIAIHNPSINMAGIHSERRKDNIEKYQRRNSKSEKSRNYSGKKFLDKKFEENGLLKKSKDSKNVRTPKSSSRYMQKDSPIQQKKQKSPIFRQPSQPNLQKNQLLFDNIQSFLQNPHLKRASLNMKSSSFLGNQQNGYSAFSAEKSNNHKRKRNSKEMKQKLMSKIESIENRISSISLQKQKNLDYYNNGSISQKILNHNFSKIIQPPTQTTYGDWRKIQIQPNWQKKEAQNLQKKQQSDFLKIVSSNFDKQLEKVSKYHRKSEQNLQQFVQNQKLLLQLKLYTKISSKTLHGNGASSG